ncbi:hypothetical protein [Archangium lansingense]|uniref:Water stress and hypersensitive response domain-containing protein n=1 Tax=Archangium lansingense TaxID=2995310 RepID=A0ABT4A0Y9_9BACT|nr:hypothetical protein [Archangium lansinium]MCY1074959.1 hypothetical protein [Archangium lansinium]
MMRRFPLLVLLLPWLAGCAGVTLRPHAMDKAVRVEEVGLAFAPDGSGALTLRLEVENPTFWDAEVTGVDFELRLDGKRYAVGTRGVKGQPLAADEKRTLTVSFPLHVESSAGAAPRTWRVEVGGGVALTFDETVRLLPFRAERYLRLQHFRPGAPTGQ